MTPEKTHRVGNRIRELRTRADLSQQQLAERVGATRQTINAIELEKYLPSLELAFKLAHVFEIPIDAIFRHPDAPAPDVVDLKTFVPARDFDLSRSFYRQIGFHENFANREVAEFECGSFRFLLQNYFVQEFAASFMMQLLVTDTAAWWSKTDGARAATALPGDLATRTDYAALGLEDSLSVGPVGCALAYR